MELKERLEFCKICSNRMFENNRGIICSKTHEKPNFNDTCNNFEVDPVQLKKIHSEQVKGELKNSFPKGAVYATIVSIVLIILKFYFRNN